MLGPVVAGADRVVRLTGRGGVPASGVRAVVVNATVTGVTEGMDLQVYPLGERPARRTSNLNAAKGAVLANLVTTAVGEDGSVGLSVSRGASHVVLDVLGWYDDGSATSGATGFTALTPDRRFDSRPGDPVTAGAARTVPLFTNVPAGVTAAVVSVTALGSSGNADVALTAPGTQPSTRTSTLNLRRGDTVANLAVVPVDAQGRAVVSVSQGQVEVVLDVMGYYSPSSTGRFTPVGPNRTYDTRDNSTALPAGEERAVTVAGLGGVPSSGVSAVLVNVTSTRATANADLQVYPSGARPTVRTSNLQIRRGRDLAVLVVAKVGAAGKVVLSSSAGATDIVFDVVGWMS